MGPQGVRHGFLTPRRAGRPRRRGGGPGRQAQAAGEGPRIGPLLEKKKLAEQLVAKGEKTGDDRLLGAVSSALRSPDAKDNKELLALSVKAGKAGVKGAGDDAIALYYLAEAYFATGGKTTAKQRGAKAVAAADGGLKKLIENETKKYDGEKKE